MLKTRVWSLFLCLLVLTGCGAEAAEGSAWPLEVEGGQILLREGTKADTLDLVLERNGAETVLRTLVQGTDYSQAADLTARPFSDILGSSGFLLRSVRSSGWGVSTYYALGPEGAVQIAQTFGFDDDHAVDLTGSGEKELVCNCVYGGDGHQTVLVFQRREDGIWSGSPDLTGLPNHDNWGVNSTSARFDPERNVFIVTYTVKNQEAPGVVEFSGLDRLLFTPYQPET